VTALVLGVGSAPGALIRFNFETPGSGAIVTFPWVLIPAFFVPVYLLAHVAVFAGLAAASERRDTVGTRPTIMPPAVASGPSK
jgi:hypothetical protein